MWWIRSAFLILVLHLEDTLSVRSAARDVPSAQETVRWERSAEESKNAHGIRGEVKVVHEIDNDKCIKCGACESSCAFGAIHIEE